ncbi:MAG: pyruvate kinase [Mogibacterium sp.]|nr:pyruvate kinase [Mogibacterium sp.]MBQ6315189.1 pyruvate kinase [Mogibacterium sp.]
MRKTKIVCTIGPASESEEMLKELCLAGMNVARLNFSHGTHAEHLERINRIKKVRAELGLPIAIMLDTKGPEFRIGTFKDGKVILEEGAKFTFTTEEVEGDDTIVSVSYKNLANELEKGDRILLNNALLEFEVLSTDGTNIVTEVIEGGELSNRKSMSFPGKHMQQIYLSEQDKSDIAFGVENDVDFIACSFVSVKQDLVDVHDYLKALGKDDTVELIAKIENQSGYDNIDEICSQCDGIMVARGDMGVEVPFERLPAIQKDLIFRCRMIGKRVITATEMLESMIHNPRPTRAETSDVANAVYDGTSAVMLSGETAAGEYPVHAVKAMAKIAEEAERNIDYKKQFYQYDFKIKNDMDAISHATCGMAMDVGADAIVACTMSGRVAKMVSRFRSPIDIIGLTTNEKTWRSLALSWAVTPKMCEIVPSTEVLFYMAKKAAIDAMSLKEGNKIVITGGGTTGISGNTNLIKIETI